MNRRLVVPLLVLVSAAAPPARAAESYDACAGTIAALPAVVTTQGVWCLKGDLATTVASGAAITVSANNVTIDCNGFKLGGLGAGPDTNAIGVYSSANNTTVRGCSIRGFYRGIVLEGGSGGHVVEDNRVEGSTQQGIRAVGDGTIVRRNQVLDTGGSSVTSIGAIVVAANVSVVDNTVAGVTGSSSGTGISTGIQHSLGTAGVVARNDLSAILPPESGSARAIHVASGGVVVRDNNIATQPGPVTALSCTDGSSAAIDNVVTGDGIVLAGCADGGNFSTVP